MQKLFVLLLLSCFATAAQAQFGTGLYPGTSCPYPYSPAPGAFNGGDETSNLKGRAAIRQNEIDQLKRRLAVFDNYIQKDRAKIEQVLTKGAMEAIDMHYEHNYSVASYQGRCGGRGLKPNQRLVTVELPDAPATTAAVDDNQVAPPAEFCYRGQSECGAQHVGFVRTRQWRPSAREFAITLFLVWRTPTIPALAVAAMTE